MDSGRICGVTFSDAVGAFVLGLILGAALALLTLHWIKHSRGGK